MLLGYARVSTDDQDFRLQRAALREAGCKRLYEKVSGARTPGQLVDAALSASLLGMLER